MAQKSTSVVYYHFQDVAPVHLSTLDHHSPCLHDRRARVLHKHISHLHIFREHSGCLPLQIVWSWIFVFSIRAERAHVAWKLMRKTMSYHLILPLEAFPVFGPRTARYRAVVRTLLRMHFLMRTILREHISTGSWYRVIYFNRYCV
jgi:hypothetical protein